MPSPELYLPSEALVEATVDAAALHYIPSPALVARTLAGSRRTRAHFRMPAHLLQHHVSRHIRLTPARAASLVFAALGLAPAALFAATVTTLFLFGGMGWMLARDARGLRAAFNSSSRETGPSERVVYSTIRARETVVATRPARSRLALDSTSAEREFASLRGEIERAVNTEVLLEGDRTELPFGEQSKVARIASLLLRFPAASIVIEADNVVVTVERRTISLGARDAETVQRDLIQRGVQPGQMTLAVVNASSPRCSSNEPNCGFGRRFVRVRLAGIKEKKE